ncbi:MAG: hypothetical protein SPF07_00095 [Eubacteriales bacterium]|nr:hypothetical protein [Eubacteriales bacterium]
MKKIFLFLSAFIPMYFLLWVKLVLDIINHNLTFNVLNTTFFILLIIVIIVGSFGTFKIIYDDQIKSTYVTIVESNNITDQHFLGYFSLFVLSAVSFDLSKVNMAVVFVFIIVMIGIVYIKNQLFYINPFLNIFGYNFYKISYIEDNKTKTDYVFCKNDIVVGLGYYVKFNKNFSFVDCSKNNAFDCSKTDNKK